jgi:hypothetical protein
MNTKFIYKIITILILINFSASLNTLLSAGTVRNTSALTYIQSNPKTTMLSNPMDYIVITWTWSGKVNGLDIGASILIPGAGASQVDKILNVTTTDDQSHQCVATFTLPTNKIVVFYRHYDKTSFTFDYKGVWYNTSLSIITIPAPAVANELSILDSTSNFNLYLEGCSATYLPSSTYVVVSWLRYNTSSDVTIMGQLVNSTGSKVGCNFVISELALPKTSLKRNVILSSYSLNSVNGFISGFDDNYNSVIPMYYEIKYKMWDSNGNGLTVEQRANIYSTTDHSSVSITPTLSNTFVQVWSSKQQNSLSGWDIFMGIYDATGGNTLTSDIQINQVTNGDQTLPKVVLLSGGNLVITWLDDQNGTQTIKCQAVTDTGILYGNVLSLPAGQTTYIDTIPLNDITHFPNQFILSFDIFNTNQLIVQYVISFNECYNFTMTTFLEYNTFSKITFTDFIGIPKFGYTLATNSQLSKTTNNVDIFSVNDWTNPSNSIYVRSTNSAATNTINYSTMQNEAVCTITYSVCYISCATCTVIGNNTNNQCVTCGVARNYFYINDGIGTNNCKSTSLAGTTNYFYPDYTSYVWASCYSTCRSCTTGGTSLTHKCTKCLASVDTPYSGGLNFYMLCVATSPYNCYSSAPTGTYLNVSCWASCDIACAACTGPLNTDCVPMQCAGGYAYKNDGVNKTCLPDNPASAPTGWYLNTSVSPHHFDQCYQPGCKACTGGGTAADHNCNTCITIANSGGSVNYYNTNDTTPNGSKQCYTSPKTGYVLIGNILTKCYVGCVDCTGVSGAAPTPPAPVSATPPMPPNTQQCIGGCTTGYYPISTNCYQPTDRVGYYYWDPTSSTFKPCDAACFFCTGPNFTDCISQSCSTSYYYLIDKTTECHNTTPTPNITGYVYINIPAPKYYWDKCYANCDTCTAVSVTVVPASVCQPNVTMNCMTCPVGTSKPLRSTTNCYPNGSSVNCYYEDNTSGYFEPCDPSCLTCTDSLPNQCVTCMPGYYPLSDIPTQCQYGTTPLQGYVLVSNIWTRCSPGCLDCSQPPTSTAHYCTSCITSYYQVNGKNPQYFCYQSSDIVPGYAFTAGAFNPCWSTCATCNAVGTYDDHMCSTCAINYAAIDSVPTQCYLISTGVPGYFYDSKASILKKCYTPCKYCNGLGDDQNHMCKECADNYYPLEDDSIMCYASDITVKYHKFKDTKFIRCYRSCLSCSDSGTDDKHNCIECLTSVDYWPLANNISQCYLKNSSVDGYYFSEVTYKFELCYQTCATCSKGGNLGSPNCLTCLKGFDNCNGCDKIIYQNQCYSECPDGTVYDEVKNTCLDCKLQNLIFYSNTCVSKCPFGYVNINGTCTSCKAQSMLYYSGSCYKICPAGTQTKDGYCDPNNTGTTNNSTTPGFSDQASPIGSFQAIDPTLIKTEDPVDNTVTPRDCNADTCQNFGFCSIKYDRPTCDCLDGFFGQYCQYTNQPNFVSNFLTTKFNNIKEPIDSKQLGVLLDFNSLYKADPSVLTPVIAKNLVNIACKNTIIFSK